MIVPRNDPAFAVSASHPGWHAVRSNRPMKTMFAFGTPDLTELEWAGATEVVLEPGSMGQAFSITSAYAPGFTQISVKGLAEGVPSPETLARLPKPVADQLAQVLMPAWDSQVRMVIGPWFPPETTTEIVAGNFRYGLTRLSNGGPIKSSSEFVSGAMATLDSYLESHTETSLDPDRMAFLSKAAPGLETDIANAMRLALTR